MGIAVAGNERGRTMKVAAPCPEALAKLVSQYCCVTWPSVDGKYSVKYRICYIFVWIFQGVSSGYRCAWPCIWLSHTASSRDIKMGYASHRCIAHLTMVVGVTNIVFWSTYMILLYYRLLWSVIHMYDNINPRAIAHLLLFLPPTQPQPCQRPRPSPIPAP